jgi:hypothetical protein
MPDEVHVTARWPDPGLYQHFLKHRRELGISRVTDYEASARRTIEVGTRFEYTSKGGELRTGYFHEPTLRFTALIRNERRIVSHYRVGNRDYPLRLPDSTYSRT